MYREYRIRKISKYLDSRLPLGHLLVKKNNTHNRAGESTYVSVRDGAVEGELTNGDN